MDKKSRDYVACLCYKVTRGDIEDIIKRTGVSDLQTLCKVAGVGDKCGGCREDLQMILDETRAELLGN